MTTQPDRTNMEEETLEQMELAAALDAGFRMAQERLKEKGIILGP